VTQQIVPVTNNPNQVFKTTLTVDGQQLTVNVKLSFNSMAGYWVMDILDQNGNELYVGIPVLSGYWPAANLLEQQQYLAVGAIYIINASQSPLDSPNTSSLGSDFILLWGDTPVP
jgi:hypothetical protein